MSNINTKLRLRDRVQVIVLAYETGLKVALDFRDCYERGLVSPAVAPALDAAVARHSISGVARLSAG